MGTSDDTREPRTGAGTLPVTADQLWEFFPDLVARFRRQGLTLEDAMDLAQTTLLEAVKNLSTFREDSTLSTWLFGIAKRQCSHFWRRARAKKRQGTEVPAVEELQDGEPGAVLKAETADPQTWTLLRERYVAVREAISTLSPRMAEALVMHVDGGHSYKEIAAHLDCKVNDVSSLIHQARKKLRRVDPGPSSGQGVPNG
jgi:RNA polymerase sigma-70 factor, ECF subfamily